MSVADRVPADDGSVQRSTVRWLTFLLVAAVVLQRFAVPGLSIPLLLPVLAVWVLIGLARGLADVDLGRATGWAIASGATGSALLAQPFLTSRPIVSVGSWALLLATWFPFVLCVRERSRPTLDRLLDNVVLIGLALAALTVAFTCSQLAGFAYVDVVRQVFPDAALLQGFVTTYPLEYGGDLYRSNAWIGLEASVVSFQIGTAALVAIIRQWSTFTILALLGSALCTASGSGLLILLAGIVFLATRRDGRAALRRHRTAGASLAVAVVLFPYGRDLLARASEVSDSRSSTSLRAVQPYVELTPTWLAEPSRMLLGAGAGASERLLNNTGTSGLLSPPPVKFLFDYGLFAGGVFAVFVLACYFWSPSPVIAPALGLSLWTIQPGATLLVLLIPLLVLVTIWSSWERADRFAISSSPAPFQFSGRPRRSHKWQLA